MTGGGGISDESLPPHTLLIACLSLYFYMFRSHYPSVESKHCDEGQGATAEDSGTKESEDERGTDFKRQRSGSKDKKGVRERDKEREREREDGDVKILLQTFQFFSPRGGLLNIFSASHRNKNAELHKIFTSLPASEKLIDGETSVINKLTTNYIIFLTFKPHLSTDLLLCSSKRYPHSWTSLCHSVLALLLCQHLFLGDTGM